MKITEKKTQDLIKKLEQMILANLKKKGQKQ